MIIKCIIDTDLFPVELDPFLDAMKEVNAKLNLPKEAIKFDVGRGIEYVDAYSFDELGNLIGRDRNIKIPLTDIELDNIKKGEAFDIIFEGTPIQILKHEVKCPTTTMQKTSP